MISTFKAARAAPSRLRLLCELFLWLYLYLEFRYAGIFIMFPSHRFPSYFVPSTWTARCLHSGAHEVVAASSKARWSPQLPLQVRLLPRLDGEDQVG